MKIKGKIVKKNQKGQGFVEFVLLLAVIMLLSLGFMKIVNTGVEKYWQTLAQILVEDPSQTMDLR